jgi:hypothetical protein
VDNRNGLSAAAMATPADGYAEREAALLMLEDKQRDRSRRITQGADKAFDTKSFVGAARKLKVTVHVKKNDNKCRSNPLNGDSFGLKQSRCKPTSSAER